MILQDPCERLAFFSTRGGINNENDKVVITGLPNTGKQDIVDEMIEERTVENIREFGEQVQLSKFGNGYRNMDILEQGPRCRSIHLMIQSFRHDEVDGIILVVDSSQPWCPQETDEYTRIFSNIHLRFKPILIFANKQDLPAARTLPEIIESSGMLLQNQRLWHIQPCSAKTGEGIQEGFLELSRMIGYHKKIKNPSL